MEEFFTDLEREVIELKVQAESAENQSILREQLAAIKSVFVEDTGVGFFKNITLDRGVRRLPPRNERTLAGVGAVIHEGTSRETSIVFVMFIEDGQISMLESACVDEKWPESLSPHRVSYTRKVG